MAYANKKNTNTNIEDESTLKRFLWLQKNFLYCFVLTAIIWVVGLCYYIENCLVAFVNKSLNYLKLSARIGSSVTTKS